MPSVGAKHLPWEQQGHSSAVKEEGSASDLGARTFGPRLRWADAGGAGRSENVCVPFVRLCVGFRQISSGTLRNSFINANDHAQAETERDPDASF